MFGFCCCSTVVFSDVLEWHPVPNAKMIVPETSTTEFVLFIYILLLQVVCFSTSYKSILISANLKIFSLVFKNKTPENRFQK